MRRLVPLCLLVLVCAAVPGTADARKITRYRVGIGEQDPAMFGDAAFKRLNLKRVRFIVPWDFYKADYKIAEVGAYLQTARRAHVEVLLHLTATANCYDGRYSKAKRCRAPTVSAYTKSVKAIRRYFPSIHVLGAWNEANHKSQPVYRRPGLAARYYKAMRRVCRTCTIVAGDFLDEPNLARYARAFRRVAPGARLWGLHNYRDVNRLRSVGTRTMLRSVPGRVWLTETGGIVRFKGVFSNSTRRAAKRLGYVFRLADRYSRRGRGRSRIARLYAYTWRGEPKPVSFDAGLVRPDGTPRLGYKVFRKQLRRHVR